MKKLELVKFCLSKIVFGFIFFMPCCDIFAAQEQFSEFCRLENQTIESIDFSKGHLSPQAIEDIYQPLHKVRIFYCQSLVAISNAIEKNSSNEDRKLAAIDYLELAYKIFSNDFYLKKSVYQDYADSKLKDADLLVKMEESNKIFAKNSDKLKKSADKINQQINSGEKYQKGTLFNYYAQTETPNDVVAQVLNYSSGVAEDGSGDSYYYPVDISNGRCLYKIGINDSNPLMNQFRGLAQASQFAESIGISGLSGINSVMKNGIDLSKVNLDSITFFQKKSIEKNKYGNITQMLKYETHIDGVPDIFECDSSVCNIQRLQRGWALVKSTCKGIKKAF